MYVIYVSYVMVDNAGECQKRILDAASRYNAMKEQHEKDGKTCPGPEGDGVLIFDEVRVVARLMWNSRNQRVVGFSMSHDDMANLLDVYQALDPDAATQNTTYVLQFLWRDLTSSFDVVGPYYTSSKTMESKYILGVVLETVKLFIYMASTHVFLSVIDGASSNLSTITTTMGEFGVFESTAVINPSFTNPFNPSRKIHWVIRPSHQVRMCV